MLGARRIFGGIEMALWDARGRATGVSLAGLLGGAVRPAVALTEYFSYRLPDPPMPASPPRSRSHATARR